MYSKEKMSAYMRARRAGVRAKMVAHLGGECRSCGAADGLEINHRDPQKKEQNISAMYDRTWTDILLELAKCELLCKTCHLAETSRQRRAGEITFAYRPRLDPCLSAFHPKRAAATWGDVGSRFWPQSY